MRYGHYDDEQREYVIERPDTPLPWINYLGSEAYFGLVSNTGGGYSFYQDARLRRLIRYRYYNAPADVGGRYLYLRDNDIASHPTGPLFWSPTWQPVRCPLDEYECRHGLGYTIIRSKLAGIASQVRYLVPRGQSLEVWELSLTNQRNRPVHLSVFSAVEFCLWDAWDDATNFQRNLNIGEVEVVNGVIYHKTEYRERRNHFAFLACSENLAGFETQREAFLGPYRGWEAPRAVELGQMSNSIAHGWQPIGAQQIQITLAPGERQSLRFVLGYQENPEDEKFDPPGSSSINKRRLEPILARYLRAEEVEHAFLELRTYWDELLSTMQVTTPDEHTNRIVNIWNPYQLMITFNLSRSASYFESGVGRGIGFRDANQDLLGFVHLVPKRARQRLLELASTQLESGGVYHQYQPLTRRGNNEVGSNFNDDPLWLILATAAYLKETGDWTILDEPVPYDSRPGSENPLFEHLLRSTAYTLERLGPHRLPLIGRADWNDCLNLNSFSEAPGQSFQTVAIRDGLRAESVLIAGLFILASQEMAEMAHRRGLGQEAKDFERAAQEMEKAVWSAGWDGQWFRRAFDDAGQPVGSKDCREGQIYIEPQGVCVMAGLGLQDGRAQEALDAVAARLATRHGIQLLEPAYSRYYLQLGEISSYPPGYKENGAVFCHTNPWVMIAETRVGRGDRAFDYYLRLNPSAREDISDVHRCEPYVYAQMIAGREAPTHGEAKNSWLTGTASWAYVAVTQWILGIRPTYEGLQVAPVMPSAWSGFEVVREFRGVRYRIQVRRKGPGNRVALEVNGKATQGTLVPPPPAGTREVDVLANVGEA